MNELACSKCGVVMRSYWLKDGFCGGCRNPDSIVRAIPSLARRLRVYPHNDAMAFSDGGSISLLAIGYGDASGDLCYFTIGQRSEALRVCAELNLARGHI